MRIISCTLLFLLWGCSPIKSSPNDQEHQTELTLHQMKATLDDVSHDVQCFKTEIEILDEKIHHAKDQKTIEKINQKQKTIANELSTLTEKVAVLQKKQSLISQDLDRLSSHSNNVTLSLKQFKDKISLLQKNQKNFDSAIGQLLELKTSIENIAKLSLSNKKYKVQPGDSLEKIARQYKTSVDKLREANSLKDDLIVVGQELKIP